MYLTFILLVPSQISGADDVLEDAAAKNDAAAGSPAHAGAEMA